MRATILILALLTTPALASDWRETCGTIGELAETVMERRQEGTSMPKMMGVITDAREIAEPMIIDAYEQPRYQTPEMQRRTIENFRDKWYLACARDLRP